MQEAYPFLIPLLRYVSHSHGMANSEVETPVCDGVHTTKIQTTHDGKIAIWFTSRFASFSHFTTALHFRVMDLSMTPYQPLHTHTQMHHFTSYLDTYVTQRSTLPLYTV